MADKLRAQQLLEQLQAKYVGTGHADITRWEFEVNAARDTYASILGHPALMSQMALGMGIHKERLRLMLMEKYIQPCGPPPPRAEE